MIIDSYKQLIAEIDTLNDEIDCCDETLRILKRQTKGPTGYKQIKYSDMPKGSNPSIPLDNLIERLIKAEEEKELKEQLLEIRTRLKQKIEKRLSSLEGNEYQVVYKRDKEGKSMGEIAAELYLTEGWVKQISMKFPRIKKLTTNELTTRQKL